MNYKKYLSSIIFTCSICNLAYADSIIFLPEYKESQTTNNTMKNLPPINPPTQDNTITNDIINSQNNQVLSPLEQINFAEEIMLADNTPSQSSKQSQKDTQITKQYNVHNGTIFIATTNEKNPDDLKLDNKNFSWLPHPKDPSKKIAFIPINYRSKLGMVNIGNNITLNITQGNYRKEQIQITDSNKIKPNQTSQERIAKELDEANKIYGTYTKERYWNTPFELPMNSMITSPFGSARLLNKEVKSFHGGTDFRAAIGTPIKASNDGIVVIAKERFLAGKSVVLSHGEGIFSMYYHCSDIKVKVGQRVKKGEIVALSGATGRVSGPHLHFGILVNGVQVNPIDFIEKVNALF